MNPAELVAIVDFVNLHSYDFSSLDFTSNAAAINSENSPSIAALLSHWTLPNVNVSKINIGIPFYGSGVLVSDATKHGLFETIVQGSQFKLSQSQVDCQFQ